MRRRGPYGDLARDSVDGSHGAGLKEIANFVKLHFTVFDRTVFGAAGCKDQFVGFGNGQCVLGGFHVGLPG